MNFNQINRNSLMSCLYSDRPSYTYQSVNDSWKNNLNEQHHLNPSKSKVNVRQSLNKTTQNYTTTNSTLAGIRNSCVLNNPSSTTHPAKQDILQDDKYFKAAKENQEPTSERYARDNFSRYSQVMPSPNFNEERRKSQSAHIKSFSKDEFALKFDDERVFQGEKLQNTDQIKAQIVALTRRVAENEQQISKLKERSDKDKKIQIIEKQMAQYRSQIFQYYKFNSSHFSELQAKLHQNQKYLNELREKTFVGSQREEILRKTSVFETKLNELYEGFKIKEEYNMKCLSTQTNTLEVNLRKWMIEQISSLKNNLEKSSGQLLKISSKVLKIEDDLVQKLALEQYKRSNKKCLNSITIENREILIIKEGEVSREKSKPYLNYEQTPRRDYSDSRKDYFDQTPRKDYASESKRELIIKQKTYYIDSQGYLLDQNKYYLLNNKNEQIMIPEHLISCLNENNMLTTTRK